jgi:hypothetical protein
MNTVCAIPIIRINSNFLKAIDSLLNINHKGTSYLLYFDFVPIVGLDAEKSWSDFTTMLFANDRWNEGSVTLVSSTNRNGLISSWNTSAALAWNLDPNAQLFFWGSDHDVWEKDFLNFPISVFENQKDVGLVVPQCGDIADVDTIMTKSPSTKSNLSKFHGPFAPGYSVYGVFNIGSSPQLPNTLLPDRLLISLISKNYLIIGETSGKAKYLRRRVEGEEFSINRQISNLWGGNSEIFWHRVIPWWLVHIFFLTKDFAKDGFGLKNRNAVFWYKVMFSDRISRSIFLGKIYKIRKLPFTLIKYLTR